MAQGRDRGPCLGPNLKFFLKRFLYVTILIPFSYHSFKPLFLFSQNSARSSLKKFENKKWPKARRTRCKFPWGIACGEPCWPPCGLRSGKMTSRLAAVRAACGISGIEPVLFSRRVSLRAEPEDQSEV